MINPWLFIPLLLAFIVLLGFRDDRNKKWIFSVWFPVMAFASAGTLFFLCAILGIGTPATGPDRGIAGVAIIAIGVFYSPFLILLYLCLKYRPGAGAYILPYVLPTVLIVLLVAAVVFLLVHYQKHT
jgi:hypothetical protein